jgi:hypothetical protein
MLAVSAGRCVEGAGSGDDEGRVVLVASQDHVPSVPSGRCAGKEPTSSLPIAPHAATTPRAAPQATFQHSSCRRGAMRGKKGRRFPLSRLLRPRRKRQLPRSAHPIISIFSSPLFYIYGFHLLTTSSLLTSFISSYVPQDGEGCGPCGEGGASTSQALMLLALVGADCFS